VLAALVSAGYLLMRRTSWLGSRPPKALVP
jgi:hypothetical protein